MKLQEAKILAEKYQNLFPDLVLSGSVALILSGDMPIREIGDVDFVTEKQNYLLIKGQLLQLGFKSVFDESYDCEDDTEETFENLKNTEGVNIMVYNRPVPIYTKRLGLLTVQDSKQIIYYKNKMARPKDLQDLKGIL